jgi:hypothetical protein
MAEGITKIEYDGDPMRCHGIISGSRQCGNVKLPTGNFCPVHAGAGNDQTKANLRNYQLTVFKARLQRHADSPILKSLRDEVGILRMMLETILNNVATDTDLVIAAPRILEITKAVTGTVEACHKLEDKLGEHLDRTTLMKFGEKIIAILGEEIVDKALLQKVSERIGRIEDEHN